MPFTPSRRTASVTRLTADRSDRSYGLVSPRKIHADQTDIHSLGDAFFFSTVQLLTISSQIANPLTSGGRIVDVALQVWAVIVVASIGGSFAAFFLSGDRS